MNDIAVNAEKPDVVLPVTLSEPVRRDMLIASGAEPEPTQLIRIEELTELPRPLRERVVDLLTDVRIRTAEDFPPGEPPTGSPAVSAYGPLIRGVDDWELWKDPSDSKELRMIFRAGPGRTLTLREVAVDEYGEVPIDALLDGRPLVQTLNEPPALTVDDVVAAYDQALELVEALTTLASDCYVGRFVLFDPVQITDDFILIDPSPGKSGEASPDPVGLVRGSDPEAFRKTLEICEDIVALPIQAQEEFAADACATVDRLADVRHDRRWLSDSDIVAFGLRGAADRALSAHEQREATARAREQYERDRTSWISTQGSKRLRLAAERGYKHDGLYRDERLADELPGFITALPKRSEVKGIINPSELALDLESRALKALTSLGATQAQVKLLYVRIDSREDTDLDDGEYVQVTGYLGQHTVWQSVSASADDIPF